MSDLYPSPLPPGFVPYGSTPSDFFDEENKRWYKLRLGSMFSVKSTFRVYCLVWEDPYYTVREVPLGIDIFHALFAIGDETLFVSGTGDRGDVYIPIWEA